MSKFVHTLLQTFSVGGHLVNLSAVPLKYQPIVGMALALVQAGLALYNHQNGDANVQGSK